MLYEIYGTQNCTFCHKAKQLLMQYDKAYTFIDVGSNKDMMAAFLNRFPGTRTVPQIVLGEDHIGGYNELKNSLTLDQIESIL